MGFQTGRDIYVVSVDVVLRHDDVSQIDADTNVQASIQRAPDIPCANGVLELHGKPNGACGAPEQGQEPVTGVLDDPGGMSGDAGLDDSPKDRTDPSIGSGLVRRHAPRVVNGISDQDDRQAGIRNVDPVAWIGLDKPQAGQGPFWFGVTLPGRFGQILEQG